MSVSGGAHGTLYNTDDESSLSVSYSESEASDTNEYKERKRVSVISALNENPQCADCQRFLKLGDTEAKSLRTLIVTHIKTAHRGKIQTN